MQMNNVKIGVKIGNKCNKEEAMTYIPNPDRISIIGDGRLNC